MTQKQTELRLIRMSEVKTQEVRWLWHPYMPFGKITIIQGNPGEGKTTLALRLAAACSRGQALPGMEPGAPINILYQTAEDGLGDTIKPRLMSAGADLNRIVCIDETERSLSLLDNRIEQGIRETNAKLLILDPLQGYLGRNVDMNRANEIRDVLKRLTVIADQTGCAVVLIGHLNKAVGANSAYRGLGSMDFRAAARSVLLVGRMKKEPHVRVIVHDKSSLAPEGKSVAFSLGADMLGLQQSQIQMLMEIQSAAVRLATKEELQAYLDSRVQELESCVQATQSATLDFQREMENTASEVEKKLSSQAGKMSDSFSQNLSLEQDRMKRYSTRLFWISLIPSAALVILELVLRIWPVI